MAGPETAPTPKPSLAPKLIEPTVNFAGWLRISGLVNSEDGGKSRVGEIVTVCGWSRTVRKHGQQFCFVALSDGSCSANLQVVIHATMPEYDKLVKCGVGCSFKLTGEIVESPAAGQAVELLLKDPETHKMTIFGTTDQTKYPLAKKQHGREYLREIAHLRPRTYLIGAATRVRSQMAMAIHRFFQDRGFLYIHTPIITASDCEGAGEMFQVSTMMNETRDKIPADKSGKVDFKEEFFQKPAFLTVSGQLEVENFCCALTDVYTFSPAFRAEKSHTARHLAEFWMVEPEIAFAEIKDCMDLSEACVKFCVDWALTNCKGDLEWFEKNVEKGLISRLQEIVCDDFERITYTDAVEQLKPFAEKFTVKPEWGVDLGSEHERFLTEEMYKKPVIVYNYPKDLKSFYMRVNEDGKTVAAMDCLVPKIGEIVGGSQREERLDMLDKMIQEKNLPTEQYWWYRELRSYGTVPHSGFGLGFERLIMLVTGIDNIRDVIPFPRYPGHAEF